MKLFSLVSMVLFSLNVYSTTIESIVEKARDTESDGVIKCNPTGKNDGLIPIIALKDLKPGMTLVLTPRVEPRPKKRGFPPLIIDNDRIIITNDPAKGRINYPVIVNGNKCIIKNAYMQSLILGNEAIIVDSIVNNIRASNKKSGNITIYNTVLTSFGCSGDKNDVEIKKCTMIGPFKCQTNLKLTISESVLFSNQINFLFYDYHNRKGRIILKDNIIHGSNGYGKMEESPSSKKLGMICLEPKDLKKLWTVTFLGDNVYEMPKFKEKSYLLTEDSPGLGKGIIAEEHTVLKALKKAKEDKLKERAKKREKLREARNANIRKTPKKDTKPKSNDPNVGGIPVPPE